MVVKRIRDWLDLELASVTATDVNAESIDTDELHIGPGHVTISPDDDLDPQDAIDLLPSGGGRVEIKGPDTYVMEATEIATDSQTAIAIPDNVYLDVDPTVTVQLADGQDTSYEWTSVLANAGYNDGNQSFVIDGGVWDMNRAGQGTPDGNPNNWEAIDLKSCSDICVRNTETTNAYGDGIDSDNTTNGLIYANRAYDNQGFGYHITGGTTRTQVLFNYSTNNGNGERGGFSAGGDSDYNLYAFNVSENDYSAFDVFWGANNNGALFVGNTAIGGTNHHYRDQSDGQHYIANRSINAGSNAFSLAITQATARNNIIISPAADVVKSSSGGLTFENNYVEGSGIDVTSDDILRHNTGLVTENKGTATITSGSTSVSFDPGIDYSINSEDVQLTPLGDLGSASYFWVGSATDTSVTINVDADPTQDVDFAWTVKRDP